MPRLLIRIVSCLLVSCLLRDPVFAVVPVPANFAQPCIAPTFGEHALAPYLVTAFRKHFAFAAGVYRPLLNLVKKIYPRGQLSRSSDTDTEGHRIAEALANARSDFPPGVIDRGIHIFEHINGIGLDLTRVKSLFPDFNEAYTRRIVLTGAPYAGKTTALRSYSARLKGAVVYLPEIFPYIRAAGFNVADPRTQRWVYLLRYLLEREAVLAYPQNLYVIDRGTLDAAAYWPGDKMQFFEEMGGIEGELGRYGAVLHLEGVASSLEMHQYSDRMEGPETARQIDRKLKQIWGAHPRYMFVPHSNWTTKTERVIAWLDQERRRIATERTEDIQTFEPFPGKTIKITQQPGVVGKHPYAEAMIDAMPAMAASFERKGHAVRSVLDLGTGRGTFAVALGQIFLEARLVGTELNPEALQRATYNAFLNGVGDRFGGRWGDGIKALHPDDQFDLVTCGLPSTPVSAELRPLLKQGRLIEIDGGEDGRKNVDAVITGINPFMRMGGAVYFNHNSMIGEQKTMDLLAEHGFKAHVVSRVRQYPDERPYTSTIIPYVEERLGYTFPKDSTGRKYFEILIIEAVKVREIAASSDRPTPARRGKHAILTSS